MFKRIIKVVGFVILGFVLLIGGVIGVMAIRGDFKKKVVKPTAIDFSITKTNLTFDASLKNNQSLDNEQIFSFTISAEPLDVTETLCTLKLSNTNLITFVEWKDGKWVDYNSNKFYLNQPIYFRLNDITEGNVGDYYDGVLTITVKDDSGLLQDTLNLAIDRSITSISFEDRGKAENNIISNGLFTYEEGEYEGVVTQALEAIEGEDYPLNVITAPLKAAKPFNSGENEEAKKYDIYYVKEGQPQRLAHYEEDVKLQRYNDQGGIVEESCDFLKYDTTNNCYVFNSVESGEFEFKLSTYPTYAIQEEMENDETLSFIDKLNSEKVLTKSVVITVNGTEAEKITFEGDNLGIEMTLLQNSNWIANNGTTLDMYDLGLTLSKTNSGTEIVGRYNELKFLSDEYFTDTLTWTFKQAIVDANDNVEYQNTPIVINLYKDRLGKNKATISGLDVQNIDNTAEYDVTLTHVRDNKYYVLTLSYTKYQEDNSTIDSTTIIEFNLVSDDVAGKVLTLQKDGLSLVTVDIYKTTQGITDPYTPKFYLKEDVCDCFVLDEYDIDNETYNFKTLQSGLYLALLGSSKSELQTLINDKFITSINYNGADTVVTIMPIAGDLAGLEMQLYAIVVNSNGSWIYTEYSKTVVVTESIPSVVRSNNGELSLPIIVGESLDFGSGVDVEDLVISQEGGSYSELLIFAPRYSLLTLKPTEWSKGMVVYTYDETTKIYTPINSQGKTFEGTTKYYTKNNYKTIDTISIIEAGVEYFLLGYMDGNNFENKIVPTGANYYSKLYPVLVKSTYIPEEKRLQTAEEYVNQLLFNKQGVADLKDSDIQITYDLSLLAGRTITKSPSVYVVTTGNYSETKIYYVFNATTNQYDKVETIPTEDIANWNSAQNNYYEIVDAVRAVDVLGEVTIDDTTNINTNLTYYTLNGKTLKQSLYTYAIGSEYNDEFIADWDNYYIIVSHYTISAQENAVVESDGYITIKAFACNKNILLNNIAQTFIISASTHEINTTKEFKVNYAKIYSDTINVTSYYDFANSSIKPTVDFGGTYFEEETTKEGELYKIIAGHTDITVGWDETANDPINGKVAKISLYIDNIYNDAILQDIISKLSVRAIEYDADNNIIGSLINIANGDLSLSLEYVVANKTYSPNMKYYITIDGDYVEATIDESIINDWANKYKQYYIMNICGVFEVAETINDGHYVKFEWIYSHNNIEYRMYSPKMIILSREVTGYTIDVKQDELYVATLLTQENAPSKFYSYDKTTNKFTLIANSDLYTKNTYYALGKTKYSGDINYLLEVGYNTNYTYTVYAVDDYENYLYYSDGENYLAIKADATVAFNLSGWISANPFYAEKFEYEILNNNSLRFDYNDISKTHNIIFAQITQDFTSITLQYTDAAVKKDIKVKIVQDGNFAHNDIRVNDLENQLSTKECKIQTNIYTYNSEPIDSKMDVSISGFTVEQLGQDVSDLYKINKDNQVVENANDSNVIAKLELIGDQWVISRTSFDNITLNIKFVSLIKTETVSFEFTSPYDVQKSTTNTTTSIYSHTNFVLGTTSETDAMWMLSVPSGIGSISIKYTDPSDNKEKSITSVEGKWIISVPDVDKDTNCEFKLYYNETFITSFKLTISPNILIATDVNDVIKLDDLNNNQFDFTSLNICQYESNKEYTRYQQDDLIAIDDLSGLTYTYYTYVDKELKTPYTINVITIENNQLKVNTIGHLGTYYVNVTIYNDEGKVEVGNVKFEITTKSQVVNKDNHDIDPIEIIAKTSTEYSLDDLKSLFNLSLDGYMYYPVAQWKQTTTYIDGETYMYEDDEYKLLEGLPDETVKMYIKNEDVYIDNITYKLNNSGNYEKVTSIEHNITIYYYKLSLTDVFWINVNNENLQIAYNYENGNYVQNLDTITYSDGTYKLLGVSVNMEDYTFDMFNNQFIDSDNNLLLTQMISDNIAYMVVNNHSVIYCKQNAYVFENIANSNDILIMSNESNGKTIYKFTAEINEDSFTIIPDNTYGGSYYKNASGTYALTVDTYNANTYYKLNYTTISLENFDSLELLYGSFGEDLATNGQYVDTFEYTIELVFNDINIKTNDIYTINVSSYKVAPTIDVVLNDEYVLYNNNKNNATINDLFNISNDDNIIDIDFGTRGDDFTIYYDSIGDKYTITFKAKGNSYVTYIPVTLTYKGGKTYSYDVAITVVNQTVVNINYPYNVDNSEFGSYNIFNASINELTMSVDELYDVNDFAKYIGVDTTSDNWQNNTRIKYDLALKGDTINLVSDDLLNITRYKVFKYVLANVYTESETYYKYDNNKFIETDVTAGTFNKLKHFIMVQDATSISKVELVAVSSTYANNLQNIVDNLALNGNTISISASLNYTGYVAFKVYAGNTGAYGYYILKIVDDSQFSNVVGFGAARKTQTIAKKITGSDNVSIIEFIRTSGTDIASVANIAYDLVDNSSSNVYLFMVNSDNVKGDIASIANSQLIANTTLLESSNNLQKVTVAVVIQNVTSLVHVCNYEIILQVDVTVTPEEKVEVLNSDLYIYTTNITYRYDNTNTNNLNDDYFNITGTYGGEIKEVKFIKDGTKSHSENLAIDTSDYKSINYIDSDGKFIEFASISGTSLQLAKNVSDENFFYLQLTNEQNFVIYLRVIISPFTLTTDTQFEVGNLNTTSGVFENDFDLTKVFDNYKGEYKLDYMLNGEAQTVTNDAPTTTKLTLPTSNAEYSVNVTITLLDVLPNMSKTITIKVKANIHEKYNDEYIGYSQTGTRVQPDKVNVTGLTLSETGSKLSVTIATTKDVIYIQNATKDTTYLTIRVGSFKAVNFTLTSDAGEILKPNIQDASPYQYFVGSTSFTESGTRDLSFVHSASNLKLRLNISIDMADGSTYATSYPLYIELPTTYTLTTTYRVTGATYETVVDGSNLILKADDSNTDISKHFFGTDENNGVGGIVNGARIEIVVNGTKYTTYEDFKGLGLMTTNNPNKLEYSLQTMDGSEVSGIDNGILTFRSDDNAPVDTLTLTNTTTSIKYRFMVLSEDKNYSNVSYNKELLQVDDDDEDNELDYISLPYAQFFSATGRDVNIDFAYLQYYPTTDIDGQIGAVVSNVVTPATAGSGNVKFNFVQDTVSTEYSSKVVISNDGLQANTTYEINVTIITINGALPSISLIISDFEVTYGYEVAGQAYETSYAGTQLGKLTDNYSTDNKRIDITINDTNSYTLNYFGAANGSINHWYLGDIPHYSTDDTSLVSYSSSGMIASRSVANATYVTMMFDVVSGSKVVGRVYYNLMLQNNINIGLNPDLDTQNAVDLYLGSEIYTINPDDTTETVIDLLQSKNNDSKYNNLFVILEQYSTNNVIGENTKALYNGTDNSTLDPSVVSDYLRFSITDKYGEVEDKKDGGSVIEIVRVTSDGKLYIKGNPTGSFTLNVFSANGTGYGKSYTINVHQYDYTIAQYGEQVNRNLGSGYYSGYEIDLFKDVYISESHDTGSYAFISYRLGYGLRALQDLQVVDNVSISYEVKTFDYNTSITTIKQEGNWTGEGENITKDDLTGGALKYYLPSVKYSSDSSNPEYEIVSIRLTITYNDDPNYYFAHYLVYNAEQLTVNKFYQGETTSTNRGKVITYKESSGAWETEGSTITIMDTNNQGMYTSLTLITGSACPDDFYTSDAKYYKLNVDDSTYSQVTSSDDWDDNKYYMLNKVASEPSKYKAYVIVDGKTMYMKNDGELTYYNGEVTAQLPDNMFDNKTEFTFVIEAIDGGAKLIEDTWTIQATNPFIAKQEKPLREFFLTSEIANQDYYNINIIGLASEANDETAKGFLTNFDNVSGVDWTHMFDAFVDGIEYTLYSVKYEGTVDGQDVFTLTKSYYVLVGHNNAISFNFNGGDYYINLTIDDDELKDSYGNLTNDAIIDMNNFVTIWYYDNVFAPVISADISISTSDDRITIDGSKVKLSNINTITTNKSIEVTISVSGVSRTIELYFNIIINAKSVDTDGIMSSNSIITTAMENDSDKILTSAEIDNNINLKKALLSLIKFNGQEVATDNTTLSYYNIKVEDNESISGYTITYTYTRGSSTYMRTLYIYS